MRTLHLSTVICVLLALLCGCAEPKKTFRISALPDRWDGAWPVWPKGNQVPRFVYVGDLTGEQNFGESDEGLSAKGVFAWLVGLGRELREPVVLRRPQAVAEGVDGRIWVSDVSRQAVFLFDTSAGILEVIDHIGDTKRFVAPIGLAPTPDGGVWVSDAELALVVNLGPDGVRRQTIEGQGLIRPTGLAYDSSEGRLYVADTHRNRISVFDRSGSLLYAIGEDGQSAGQLNAPTYVALAGDRLYVTDTLNARVQVFDKQGGFLRTFGKRGLYVGNLTRPKGVAVSEDGLVYVIESFYDHLLVFDTEGRLLLPIGGTGQRPGQFYLPSGVWAGNSGRVYVADMFNGRVAVLQYLGDGE